MCIFSRGVAIHPSSTPRRHLENYSQYTLETVAAAMSRGHKSFSQILNCHFGFDHVTKDLQISAENVHKVDDVLLSAIDDGDNFTASLPSYYPLGWWAPCLRIRGRFNSEKTQMCLSKKHIRTRTSLSMLLFSIQNAKAYCSSSTLLLASHFHKSSRDSVSQKATITRITTPTLC